MATLATLPATPTRVVLADDHALVRAGIRRLIEEFAATEVVGEAADGLAALALVKLHQPDVLIADLTMPKLNGLELAGEVDRQCPTTGVLILSMHVDEECVRRAFQRGAKGYLVKDSTASELEVAIRAVARGDTYLSPAVSKYFVAGFLDQCESPPDDLESLTPRQRQILQLVAEGHTTKEIARLLKISAKTVENHRGQLMKRLAVHEVAGLVRYAVRVGL